MHSAVTPGTIMDQRYRVERQLGAGAHGAVYLADDIQLQRPVALKLVSIPVDESGELVARLQREARALNKFVNPHIVQVFRIGWRSDHEMYLAMEFVDGVSLRSLLDVKPMSFHDAIAIALQIAEALYHAEKEGVTHRDVKPQNVLVGIDEDGRRVAKLADFGLCKLQEEVADPEGRLTRTGIALGTPIYMSPEQCYGQQTDVRSDIYSFGCTLFEMLTGVPPFSGETPAALLMKHVSEQPPRLLDVVKGSGMPPQLQDIYLRCLQKNPRERYQSFAQIIQALNEIEAPADGDAGLGIQDTHRLKKYLQRVGVSPRLKVAAGLLVCLVICTCVIVYVATGDQKGQVIALVAPMVAAEDPIPFMVRGVSMVYALNGADVARSAADATTSRLALKDWSGERRVALDAAYMRFFAEHHATEHAAAFAQAVIIYYVQKLDVDVDDSRRNLSATELSQLSAALDIYLHNEIPREYWFGLNHVFDEWDGHRHFLQFLSGQPELEMQMQEVVALSVQRSGAADAGHHYRRGCTHYQCAIKLAAELNREEDVLRLAHDVISLRNPERTREYEYLSRLEVAGYYLAHNKLDRAREELAKCRNLRQGYLPLQESNFTDLDEAEAKWRRLSEAAKQKRTGP